MFSKRNTSVGNTTIIGSGARFKGTLELEGEVHIEGQCEGTIRARAALSVGAQGSVIGELHGGTVVVAGRVEGKVIAKETLRVLKSGNLRGEIYYGQLEVDSGGVIDGTTHQGAPPPLEASDSSGDVEPNPDLVGENKEFDSRSQPRSFPPQAKHGTHAVASR